MGSTMTQKLLAAKCGKEEVKPGQLIMCSLDMVLGNDITAPVAIREFERLERGEVFNKRRIALVPDHFVPNKDIKSAQQAAVMRRFARSMQIENYFEAGRAGIEHALLPEMGLVTAGDCVIGADSHTCTYGALGAFSTGVGSTDMACAMAVGKTWFKVPSAIRVRLRGRLSRYVTGKDVILELIGRIGVDGALYKSLEFCGDIGEISMDGRFAICNMAVEAGAKNGIFEVDENTLEYLRAHNAGEPVIFEADEDAEYEQEIEIRLDDVPLTVAYPSLPENTRPAAEGKDIKIDQAVIGSCTNGRMEDMRAAAEILRGRKVHPDVRCIIIPATQNIWRQCAREGLFDIFAQAGCVVSAPTCGPCLGGYMGILAEGERAVSTTNRNFIGRMGHVKSEVYLSGPYVAAASAVRGYISTPDML
ncbi:MAG: 3-isopropylmalate dehydratase large subunit [Christensenellaceae bacterium]|nr:3-isopropylmalate dehydratase large subunit [Christensenellaceae bacterium]MBS6563866.1 3-isopropylmalate dehydratase large subunit [Clostridiales bacterium]